MVGHTVRVAGFGLRAGASVASLRAALDLAGGTAGLTALATAADKAGHQALSWLAADLDLPLIAVPPETIATTPATAARTPARYGARSVAEAAALVAAGPGATLVAPRVISPDRKATAAIASRPPRHD